MNEHRPEQTRIEQFSEQFEIAKPSKALRQEILNSARSSWSGQTPTKVHSDSLVPYFAALAATILLILTVNALGNYALKVRLSEYVVTIRPCQTSQLDEDTQVGPPCLGSISLRIVGISDARNKTHIAQLQQLLSQGASHER
jgi:hypothetical protein